MNERRILETLLKRYLSNQATDAELEVFMKLLAQENLDDLIRNYMDQEEEASNDSTAALSTRNIEQLLKIAASIFLISGSF
ncbi:hypothetical protein GCM10028807_51070 [Spirosoma daeguense]